MLTKKQERINNNTFNNLRIEYETKKIQSTGTHLEYYT